jgi:hypothetical protein
MKERGTRVCAEDELEAALDGSSHMLSLLLALGLPLVLEATVGPWVDDSILGIVLSSTLFLGECPATNKVRIVFRPLGGKI